MRGELDTYKAKRNFADTPEPKGRVGRFFYRVKLTFLGLSYKLTPARRLLFAASLCSFIVGMFGDPIKTKTGGWVVDFSPFWFSVSFAMMAYLLALELADRIRVRARWKWAGAPGRLLPHTDANPSYDFDHSYRTANEVGGVMTTHAAAAGAWPSSSGMPRPRHGLRDGHGHRECPLKNALDWTQAGSSSVAQQPAMPHGTNRPS